MLNLPQLNAAGGDTTINIIKSSPSNVNDQLVSGLTKTLTDIKQSISSVTKTNNDFKSFLKSTFNQKKEKGPKETSALDLEQQRKDEKLKEETNELLRDILDALLKGYKIDKKKESEGFLSSILGSLGGMKWLNGLKLLGFAGLGAKLIALSDWFDDIKTNIGTQWTEVKEGFSKRLKGLSQWFADIKTNVGTQWTEIKEGVSKRLKGLSDWFSDIKTNVGTEWTEVKEGVSKRINGLNQWFNDIKTNIGTQWTEVKEGFSKRINGLNQWFNDIKTNVSDKWSVIDDTFRTKLTKMSDWFGEVGTTLAKIKEFPVINEISKHLTRISDWFKGLGTLKLPEVSKLPKPPVPPTPAVLRNLTPSPTSQIPTLPTYPSPKVPVREKPTLPAKALGPTKSIFSSKVMKGLGILGAGLGAYDVGRTAIYPEELTGKPPEETTLQDRLNAAIQAAELNFTPLWFAELLGMDRRTLYQGKEKYSKIFGTQTFTNPVLAFLSSILLEKPTTEGSPLENVGNARSLVKPKQIDKDKLISYATNLIAAEEGFVPEAYPDGDGYSIGYGSQRMGVTAKGKTPLRTVGHGDTITETEARQLLEVLVSEYYDNLSKHPKVGDIYSKIQSPSRKIALLSMAYQLGVGGLVGFTNTWEKIKKANETNSSEDWKAVENELKMNSEGTDESDWIKQTRNRAERTSGIIGEGGVVSRDGVVFFDPNINKDIYVQGQANGGVANKAKVVAVGEYPGAKTNPELIVKLNELSSRMIETTKKIQELNREEMMANIDLIATATERRIVNTLESSRASQRRIAMAERNQNKVYPVQMPVTTSVVDNKTINNVTQPIFMQQGSEDRHNMYFRVG